MKVKSESEVTQSCPTLSDPMDYSLPGSSAHGISQARVFMLPDIKIYHTIQIIGAGIRMGIEEIEVTAQKQILGHICNYDKYGIKSTGRMDYFKNRAEITA